MSALEPLLLQIRQSNFQEATDKWYEMMEGQTIELNGETIKFSKLQARKDVWRVFGLFQTHLQDEGIKRQKQRKGSNVGKGMGRVSLHGRPDGTLSALSQDDAINTHGKGQVGSGGTTLCPR